VDFSPALIWSWYSRLINGNSTKGPPTPRMKKEKKKNLHREEAEEKQKNSKK
jgi:hypothetical protein